MLRLIRETHGLKANSIQEEQTLMNKLTPNLPLPINEAVFGNLYDDESESDVDSD